MSSDRAPGLSSWQIFLLVQKLSHPCKILISQDGPLPARPALVNVVKSPMGGELLCLLVNSHLRGRSAREWKGPLVLVLQDLVGGLGHLLLQEEDSLRNRVLRSLEHNMIHGRKLMELVELNKVVQVNTGSILDWMIYLIIYV